MAYMLDQVLTVRERHETIRLNELAKSKNAVRQAEAERQQKEKAFEDYRQWRPQEEKRLFNRLKDKPTSVQDLHHYTDSLNKLKVDQTDMAQQVNTAADRLVSANNDMETAREHYAQAHRKKVKISEHKKLWMEQERVTNEREAENEMEEIGQNPSFSGAGRLYI